MQYNSEHLAHALSELKKNKVVAIPTETVYGLAANIFSDDALLKVFELKKRPLYNPLIVHLKSINDLNSVACDIPKKALELAKAFWPGPLTLVLKKQDSISDVITAGKDTVAVRVPNHPLALALLEQLDFPLAAPSANPFGSISPTTAAHVSQYFDEKDVFVLDGGPCAKGIESTIVGFEGEQPVLYRAGSTTQSAIEAIVGPLKIFTTDDVAPLAPGMLSKHYAPSTKSLLTENIQATLSEITAQKVGVIAFSKAVVHPSVVHQVVLSVQENLEEVASNLYAAMHELDAQAVDIILIEKVPNEGLGIAINDKLKRATV